MTDTAHMRDSDAFSWYMEQDPLLRSTVVAVAVLDGVPDWARLVDKVDRATRLIPAFRQHVVSPPLRLATPRWTVDPDFDLSWHIRRVDAPAPGDLATVLDLARIAGMTAFDRARPLWEFTLVEGLVGGGSALVMKLHHSLTDGVGGMQLALLLFDLESVVGDLGPLPDAAPGERFSTADLVRDALSDNWRRAADTAGDALRSWPAGLRAVRHPRQAITSAASTVAAIARVVQPVSQTLSPVMTERRLAWHYDVLEVPLEDLKRAGRSAGGTLNDAFLASVSGGLRRYHESHGTSVQELRVTMPVSIRHPNDPLGGNRITLMRFKVPAGEADPVARMTAIRPLVKACREDRSLPWTNTIAGALNLLPTSVVGGMLKHVDFLASDVPGFSFPVYLAGAEMRDYYAFGPTIGASVNVTLMSYRATCCVGVTIDTGAVSDFDVLIGCLREGFEEVLAVGGEHDAVRAPLTAAVG